MPKWLIGACINLIGSVCINLGTNLIKYHHVLNARMIDPLRRKGVLQSRIWIFGFIIFFLGNTLNFVSMSFAAQSLLAALGSIQFVSNVLFTAFVMKIKTTKRVIIATFIIIFGNLIIVIFANHESHDFSADDLAHLYTNRAYFWYIIVSMCCVIVLYFVSREMDKHEEDISIYDDVRNLSHHTVVSPNTNTTTATKKLTSNASKTMKAVAAAATSHPAAVRRASTTITSKKTNTKLVEVVSSSSSSIIRFVSSYSLLKVLTSTFTYVFTYLETYFSSFSSLFKSSSSSSSWMSSSFLYAVRPIIYAAVSAIIGTHSVTLAKSTSVLFRTTIAGDNQFVYAFTYAILIFWALTIAFWLYRLNLGLQIYDSIVIIPTLQVFWTLFSILDGGIYFREFDEFTFLNYVMFISGVLIVFYGIFILAPVKSSSMKMCNHDNAVVVAAASMDDDVVEYHKNVVSKQFDEDTCTLDKNSIHNANYNHPMMYNRKKVNANKDTLIQRHRKNKNNNNNKKKRKSPHMQHVKKHSPLLSNNGSVSITISKGKKTVHHHSPYFHPLILPSPSHSASKSPLSHSTSFLNRRRQYHHHASSPSSSSSSSSSSHHHARAQPPLQQRPLPPFHPRRRRRLSSQEYLATPTFHASFENVSHGSPRTLSWGFALPMIDQFYNVTAAASSSEYDDLENSPVGMLYASQLQQPPPTTTTTTKQQQQHRRRRHRVPVRLLAPRSMMKDELKLPQTLSSMHWSPLSKDSKTPIRVNAKQTLFHAAASSSSSSSTSSSSSYVPTSSSSIFNAISTNSTLSTPVTRHIHIEANNPSEIDRDNPSPLLASLVRNSII